MGHAGVGWDIQGWGGLCRGRGGVGHIGVGRSCRGGVSYVRMGCIIQGWNGL